MVINNFEHFRNRNYFSLLGRPAQKNPQLKNVRRTETSIKSFWFETSNAIRDAHGLHRAPASKVFSLSFD